MFARHCENVRNRLEPFASVRTRALWPRVLGVQQKGLLALFPEDDLHFQSRRSTLETSIVILRGRRSTSDDVSYCMFFATCIVRAASSGDSVQIPWQVWDIVRVYFILLYITHSTLYTLQSTLHTLHFTLDTPRSTRYIPHSTVNTPHFTL